MSQRSPIIVALLFAATVSVDIVFLRNVSQFGGSWRVTYWALCLSQVNLVVIWATLNKRPIIWRVAVLILTMLIATWRTWLLYLGNFADACCAIVGAMFALSVLLWCAIQTPIWQHLHGEQKKTSWQFSLKQILFILTALPLLLAAFRHTNALSEATETATLIFGSAILAVDACFLESGKAHRLLRIGGLFCAAIAIGICSTVIIELPHMYNVKDRLETLIAFFSIQALVLGIWLALGPILPQRSLRRR